MHVDLRGAPPDCIKYEQLTFCIWITCTQCRFFDVGRLLQQARWELNVTAFRHLDSEGRSSDGWRRFRGKNCAALLQAAIQPGQCEENQPRKGSVLHTSHKR